MRNRIILLIITCVLTIMYVHGSVCTIENYVNPVFYCGFVVDGSIPGLDEFLIFYIGSYLFQSLITIIIAYVLLDYKRLWLWLAVVAVFFPLAFWFKTTIHDDHLILSTHINAIDQLYKWVYANHAINAFTHIVYFSIAQLLLLATYTISDYIIRWVKKESYNEISINSKKKYIVLIFLCLTTYYLVTFLANYILKCLYYIFDDMFTFIL